MRVIALVLFTTLSLAAAAPSAAGPGCTCLANGKKFELEQVACIRGRLARCEMFLNNTSWNFIANSCPETRLAPMVRLGIAAPPKALPPACRA
jgi:hypothetical protein